MSKNYCRDPGLIRAHSSPPSLNQEPSDLQSDALPTELSRQDYRSGNEGHVNHTGLKRRLSSHAFVKRKRCIQTSEAISLLDIFEGKFENSQNSKDEE